MHNAIIAQNISKKFKYAHQSRQVLRNITITFDQGKTYAITGVSGTGKSTLMHILAGLDKPTTGTVSFNKQNLATMSTQEREQFRNQSIGLLFQSPYLIRELSVIENIMLPGLIAGKNHEHCTTKAKQLLSDVGLKEKINSKPSSLSGGQQQRAALARALFNEPTFLIADEPTGNLDIATGKAMVDLLLGIQKKWHMGIIISTHDTYVAQAMEIHYQLEEGLLKKTN